MNEEFRKRRLLDALEYIDDEYIASAARYKMKIKPYASEPPVQTVGGSLKKYWKQYLTLAACLLILALASPIFSFVAQTINSIAAGWGDVTTDEITEAPITDENGIAYTYPMFVDDLEPLSAEVMIEVNKAYIQYRYDNLFKLYYIHYQKTMDYSSARKEAEEYVSSYLAGEETHVFFNEKDFYYHKYYGIVNGCVVLGLDANIAEYIEHEVAGYVFPCSPDFLLVYTNGVILPMESAYSNGLLNNDDIQKIYERFFDYNAFKKIWIKEQNTKEQN